MGDVNRTIEAMWKVESTRFIAAIARVTREIGVAEELAQDALVAALERWPEEGIPENPAAWRDLLMKMGRFSQAREEIERAIALTQNLREQQLLKERLDQIEKAAQST